MSEFKNSVEIFLKKHEALLSEKNMPQENSNGIYSRWKNPILTAAHAPLYWRYDLNETSNPLLLERQGINAVFNAGAIYFKNKYCLVVRVEGNDRKSFFAVAESPNGIDNFRFWDGEPRETLGGVALRQREALQRLAAVLAPGDADDAQVFQHGAKGRHWALGIVTAVSPPSPGSAVL